MVLILDGGSTCVLPHINSEDHAAIMSSPLWTSQALFSHPEQVKAMYRDYIAAGAQLVSCMTYQQSEITMSHVKDNPEAYNVGMQIALEACQGTAAKPVLTLGTHAAMLSNGAEYNHKYHESDRAMLSDFHTRRLSLFSAQKCWKEIEYIAFETLPDFLEAEVLLEVLSRMAKNVGLNRKRVWISFSCSGDLAVEKVLAAVTSLLASPFIDQLWGIGVNCFKEDKAHVVEPLCKMLQPRGLFAIIYPDAGRQWDPVARQFTGESMDATQWARGFSSIIKLNDGRLVLGGCCQTDSGHIAAIKAVLEKE